MKLVIVVNTLNYSQINPSVDKITMVKSIILDFSEKYWNLKTKIFNVASTKKVYMKILLIKETISYKSKD